RLNHHVGVAEARPTPGIDVGDAETAEPDGPALARLVVEERRAREIARLLQPHATGELGAAHDGETLGEDQMRAQPRPAPAPGADADVVVRARQVDELAVRRQAQIDL